MISRFLTTWVIGGERTRPERSGGRFLRRWRSPSYKGRQQAVRSTGAAEVVALAGFQEDAKF